MADLTYIANVSLDGYIEDADGNFGFSEPGEDAFAYLTSVIEPIGTFLYGRRLYDVMAVWETDPAFAEASEPYARFAAAWSDADKVVYSSTLVDVSTARTRIVRSFDFESARDLKVSASAPLAIGGADLAAQAFAFGLIDEVHLVVRPVALGGGKAALPGGSRLELDLKETRRFADGGIAVRYAVRR